MLSNSTLPRNSMFLVFICLSVLARAHPHSNLLLPHGSLIQLCQAAASELHPSGFLPLRALSPQPIFIPRASFPLITCVLHSLYFCPPESGVASALPFLRDGLPVNPTRAPLSLFFTSKCVISPQVVFLPLCS